MQQIFSWNVNGIRACAKKGFFHWLEESEPDIVAVQETRAQPEQLDSDFIERSVYRSYWLYAEKKGYSGVALYTRQEPLTVERLGVSRFDKEGRTLIAEYPDFTLVNCYFPNSQREGARLDYKLDFCRTIFERCEALRQDGKRIVLCGDYNIAHKPIDLKNPDSNVTNPGYLPEERAWMSSFLSADYVDTFRSFYPEKPGCYTWWSYRFNARARNIGWRIDYVCVDSEFSNAVTAAEIHDTVTGSDHCPVSVVLDV